LISLTWFTIAGIALKIVSRQIEVRRGLLI
jgi:hypothetical protein